MEGLHIGRPRGGITDVEVLVVVATVEVDGLLAVTSMSKTIVSSFALNLGFVAILFGLGWHLGLNIRNERLMENEMQLRAEAQFHLILLARRWNSDYGGVYVEKTSGVSSNPYLENPDIIAADGKVFTVKIPAEMTKEISEYANREGAFRFHFVPLVPLKPPPMGMVLGRRIQELH